MEAMLTIKVNIYIYINIYLYENEKKTFVYSDLKLF